ncbi:MAG: glycoside hydrolase family 3 C-terminal domain-containing protein [Clostridium sp.]|nr:glycoside hydrolase family 3 C-terminal domain-containing protein [Clostridium sp.]MCM1398701.1 glycoside hydrolase family 3 C-terminal domain-containing protein [Clostridium sp.]MCM1458668.1 glycoside hydrolase family 3 C-terminal domain-containing protein [Bacteroides sp.]
MKYVLDWNEYQRVARQAVAEGLVLLENNNNALPFTKGMEIAVFGRIQTNYYKSGTGSGGMVNVSHVTDILEGLRESNVVTINEPLLNVYEEWEKEHPFIKGLGWGMEPWSQEEMPVDDALADMAAKSSDAALVIIGRTAGEDKDSTNTPGSFCLTDIEMDMLHKVRNAFSRMVVLLNVGGIIDMQFVDTVKPDAVIYGWQGGMTGGHGTADVLTGKVCPSGRMSDTVAYLVSDYISDKNFGDAVKNFYCDDIYVGYRYFETFARDRVRYPFGYGLSYTTFDMECKRFRCDVEKRMLSFDVDVTNTGKCEGKQVVQIYACAPMGKLGKPARVLVAFGKTKTLARNETCRVHLEADFSTFASYDDSGVTGHAYCFLLEQGSYSFYLGENVRDTMLIDTVTLDEIVLEQLEQALAPYEEFERIKPNEAMNITYERVPLAAKTQEEKSVACLPEEIPYTGHKGIMLRDVLEAETGDGYSPLMREFVGQLSDEELASIIRGEGMGSSLVTPGTAAAFGGVSKALRELGIPVACCDDGPSGMRFDCGAKAFSLPNGTLLGCTFNEELNFRLFRFLGLEMISNKVECLLGPGMNIHRHPLNGRNFEYFSEDPLLTGTMATAQLRALKSCGVGGTIKHFCGNNQEFRRRHSESVISERALREIYLKGFEMAVKSGYSDSVMTTYGKLNGRYTANIYDLTTTILRKEWGFRGIVMTDWWAAITMRPDGGQKTTDFAAMARSQGDLYMVCPDGETNASHDNTLEALKAGSITRGELQRNAINICDFVMHTEAMKRMMGAGTMVEVVGRSKDKDDFDMSDVEYRILDREIVIPLDDTPSVMGTNYVLAFDTKVTGTYHVTLRGSSDLSELAQMTCTLFQNGFPVSTMTFHGTGGELDSISRDVLLGGRFEVMRLYVGAEGVRLKDIEFKLKEDGTYDADTW